MKIKPPSYPKWVGFVAGLDVTIKLIGHHFVINAKGKTLIIPTYDVRVHFLYSPLKNTWNIKRIENLIDYL